MRYTRIPAFLSAALLAACSAHSTLLPAYTAGSVSTLRPMACSLKPAVFLQTFDGSPGSIKPPPMVNTPRLPASAMRSPANRSSDSIGFGWTQIPGTASQVAAGPDGRFYVLSDGPAGPDKFIWQNIGGPWQSLKGQASQIAISPATNTLYAINSAGSIYATCDGVNWTPLGGGARSISVDINGFVYVVSNAPGADAAIWQYQNGPWVQVGGVGTALAGTWDMTAYTLPTGTISSGTYILNSAGGIYHENPDATFASLPASASMLAPSPNGGVFALGYPASANGNVIFYYSLSMPGWIPENGSAVSIATNGVNLYAIGASGAIYQTTGSGMQFGGGSASQSLTNSGGTVAFPSSGSYGGYSGTANWPATVSPSSYTLTTSWATGSGDVSAPFITLPGSIGTALLYLDFRYAPLPYPAQQSGIQYASSPALTVTTAGTFPGSANKCGFATWSAGTTGWSWSSMTNRGVAEVTPSGTSFTVPSTVLTGGPLTFNPGQDVFMALYCR